MPLVYPKLIPHAPCWVQLPLNPLPLANFFSMSLTMGSPSNLSTVERAVSHPDWIIYVCSMRMSYLQTAQICIDYRSRSCMIMHHRVIDLEIEATLTSCSFQIVSGDLVWSQVESPLSPPPVPVLSAFNEGELLRPRKVAKCGFGTRKMWKRKIHEMLNMSIRLESCSNHVPF